MVSRNRLLLVGLFGACLVFTTSAFVMTESAYIASLNTENATGEVVDTELVGSGSDLAVAITIRIKNPTRHQFTVWSIVLDVKMDGIPITDRSTDFGTWTVSATDTETKTIELPVKQQHRQKVQQEFNPDEIRIDGYVWASVVDSEIVLTIGTPDPRAQSTPTPQSAETKGIQLHPGSDFVGV
ncbi:MAG: hypothetical protein SVG88_13645 [Halobacteriales archaeon]|nr:hypothetical protein [Halobacteriales archaeon]